MKNSNETIENRTRDHPACSAVPQPTAYRVPHLLYTWANLSFQEAAGSVVLVVTKYSRKKEIKTERKKKTVQKFPCVWATLRHFANTNSTDS